jgi:hypothetical protein
MGTMNGMQRPSLSDEAVARLIDPRTGQRLRPLGVVGGRIVWPQMGASPDDPSDNGSADGGEGTDGGDNPEGEGSPKDSDKDGDADEGSKPEGNPDAKIEDLEQEKERHYRRRKEAENERDEYKRQLEELKGKDTPELEKVQQQVVDLETQNKALSESLRQAHLENAFLKDNSYTWHNPGRALKLADLSEVEIDDDGTVHGLKKALDALAKSDAYLLKQEDKQEKKDPPNTGEAGKNPSKREQKDKSAKTKEAELLNKYPALRR